MRDIADSGTRATTNGTAKTSTRDARNGARSLHDQQVHHVSASGSTAASGKATPELIAEALTYLHRDGIIVLENAIDPSHLDALEAMLGPEALEIAKDPNHRESAERPAIAMHRSHMLTVVGSERLQFWQTDAEYGQSQVSSCTVSIVVHKTFS